MILTTSIIAYLIIHGISTIGAIIIFLIRNEHRITKLETSLDNLKQSHDKLTDYGTNPHLKKQGDKQCQPTLETPI